MNDYEKLIDIINDAEKEYLEYIGYSTDEYEIITWPESQVFIGHPDAELIVDERGMEMFGSSAYIIPKGIEPIDDE